MAGKEIKFAVVDRIDGESAVLPREAEEVFVRKTIEAYEDGIISDEFLKKYHNCDIGLLRTRLAQIKGEQEE